MTDVLVDGLSVGAVASYVFRGVAADHSIAAFFALDSWDLTVVKAGRVAAR